MDDLASQETPNGVSSESHFCDICNLEYTTKNDLKEHTWSLLHHKKLDKEKGRDYLHSCVLCNEGIFGLLSFTKHIHGDQHQKKLQEWKTSTAPPTQVDTVIEDDIAPSWVDNYQRRRGRGQAFYPPRNFNPRFHGPRFMPRPRGYNPNRGRAARYQFHNFIPSAPRYEFPVRNPTVPWNHSFRFCYGNKPRKRAVNLYRQGPLHLHDKSVNNAAIRLHKGVDVFDKNAIESDHIEVLETSFTGFEATKKMREKMKEFNGRNVRPAYQHSNLPYCVAASISSAASSLSVKSNHNPTDAVGELPYSLWVTPIGSECTNLKSAESSVKGTGETPIISDKNSRKESVVDQSTTSECPFVGSKEEEVLSSYVAEHLWAGTGENGDSSKVATGHKIVGFNSEMDANAKQYELVDNALLNHSHGNQGENGRHRLNGVTGNKIHIPDIRESNRSSLINSPLKETSVVRKFGSIPSTDALSIRTDSFSGSRPSSILISSQGDRSRCATTTASKRFCRSDSNKVSSPKSSGKRPGKKARKKRRSLRERFHIMAETYGRNVNKDIVIVQNGKESASSTHSRREKDATYSAKSKDKGLQWSDSERPTIRENGDVNSDYLFLDKSPMRKVHRSDRDYTNNRFGLLEQPNHRSMGTEMNIQTANVSQQKVSMNQTNAVSASASMSDNDRSNINRYDIGAVGIMSGFEITSSKEVNSPDGDRGDAEDVSCDMSSLRIEALAPDDGTTDVASVLAPKVVTTEMNKDSEMQPKNRMESLSKEGDLTKSRNMEDQQVIGSSNVSIESSIISLDESLKSSNLSNQCEFRYQNGKRCPTSAEHKFCSYHEKVVRDVFIHHARFTAFPKSQKEQSSPSSATQSDAPLPTHDSFHTDVISTADAASVSLPTANECDGTLEQRQSIRQADSSMVFLSDSDSDNELLTLQSRFKYLHKATKNPLSGLEFSRTNLPPNIRKLLQKRYGAEKKGGGGGDDATQGPKDGDVISNKNSRTMTSAASSNEGALSTTATSAASAYVDVRTSLSGARPSSMECTVSSSLHLTPPNNGQQSNEAAHSESSSFYPSSGLVLSSTSTQIFMNTQSSFESSFCTQPSEIAAPSGSTKTSYAAISVRGNTPSQPTIISCLSTTLNQVIPPSYASSNYSMPRPASHVAPTISTVSSCYEEGGIQTTTSSGINVCSSSFPDTGIPNTFNSNEEDSLFCSRPINALTSLAWSNSSTTQHNFIAPNQVDDLGTAVSRSSCAPLESTDSYFQNGGDSSTSFDTGNKARGINVKLKTYQGEFQGSTSPEIQKCVSPTTLVGVKVNKDLDDVSLAESSREGKEDRGGETREEMRGNTREKTGGMEEVIISEGETVSLAKEPIGSSDVISRPLSSVSLEIQSSQRNLLQQFFHNLKKKREEKSSQSLNLLPPNIGNQRSSDTAKSSSEWVVGEKNTEVESMETDSSLRRAVALNAAVISRVDGGGMTKVCNVHVANEEGQEENDWQEKLFESDVQKGGLQRKVTVAAELSSSVIKDAKIPPSERLENVKDVNKYGDTKNTEGHPAPNGTEKHKELKFKRKAEVTQESNAKRPRMEGTKNKKRKKLRELTEKESNIQKDLSLAEAKISKYKLKIAALKEKTKTWRLLEKEWREALKEVTEMKELVGGESGSFGKQSKERLALEENVHLSQGRTSNDVCRKEAKSGERKSIELTEAEDGKDTECQLRGKKNEKLKSISKGSSDNVVNVENLHHGMNSTTLMKKDKNMNLLCKNAVGNERVKDPIESSAFKEMSTSTKTELSLRCSEKSNISGAGNSNIISNVDCISTIYQFQPDDNGLANRVSAELLSEKASNLQMAEKGFKRSTNSGSNGRRHPRVKLAEISSVITDRESDFFRPYESPLSILGTRFNKVGGNDVFSSENQQPKKDVSANSHRQISVADHLIIQKFSTVQNEREVKQHPSREPNKNLQKKFVATNPCTSKELNSGKQNEGKFLSESAGLKKGLSTKEEGLPCKEKPLLKETLPVKERVNFTKTLSTKEILGDRESQFVDTVKERLATAHEQSAMPAVLNSKDVKNAYAEVTNDLIGANCPRMRQRDDENGDSRMDTVQSDVKKPYELDAGYELLRKNHETELSTSPQPTAVRPTIHDVCNQVTVSRLVSFMDNAASVDANMESVVSRIGNASAAHSVDNVSSQSFEAAASSNIKIRIRENLLSRESRLSNQNSHNLPEVSNYPSVTPSVETRRHSPVKDMQVYRGHLYVCSNDKEIRIHKTKSDLSLKTQIKCSEPITCLEMHCRDKTPMLFAGSSGSKVFYYDLYTLQNLGSFSFPASVQALHIGFGNLYVGLGNGTLSIINVKKMHKVGQLKLDENIQSIEKAQNHKLDSKVVKSIQSAVICQVQDLRRFLIVLLESAIFVIDAPAVLCLKWFSVRSSCLEVHKKKFYCGSKSGQVHCGDLEDLREPRVVCNQNGEVISLKIIGDLIITSSSDCFIRCFDIKSGNLLRVYGDQKEIVTSLAFDPTNQMKIFTGSENGDLKSICVNLDKTLTCMWKDCGLPFGISGHLKMHILDQHVNMLEEDRCCGWKSCSYSYAPSHALKDSEGNQRHIDDHLETILHLRMKELKGPPSAVPI